MFHMLGARATMTRLIGFLAILILLSRSALTAPACSNVVNALVPCVNFIKGGSKVEPSKSCCAGVKTIGSAAKTKEDRRFICQCIKKALGNVPNYNPARIPLLSKKCNVPITLPPISKNYDCSKAITHYVV